MNHQKESEKDELRARFTGWLKVTVYRAKLNYMEKKKRQVDAVSMEVLSEDIWVKENSETEWIKRISAPNEFDFEEEKMARAFYDLPLLRQKILTMLFVEEKSPKEIAERLNCSVRHVYKQRSLALEKLRVMLGKGGDER